MGLFKTYSEKEVKRVMPLVNKINSLEDLIRFKTIINEEIIITDSITPKGCMGIEIYDDYKE